MYGCQTWTIKKAEYQRTDAFKLWCWGRHLSVPWTARNQSILKEINPKYSLEGLILKLQYYGHQMRRADSLANHQKILMLGKTGGRRRGQQRMRWLDGIINSTDTELEQTLGDSEGQENLVCCMQLLGLQKVRHNWATKRRHCSKLFICIGLLIVTIIVTILRGHYFH